MLYVCVTKTTELSTMNNYIGTVLIHTDPDFLVWLWSNPNQQDIQAANVIMMGSIHLG